MEYAEFTDQFVASLDIKINKAYVKNRMVSIFGQLTPTAAGSYKIIIPASYRPKYNLAGSYFVSAYEGLGCVLAVYVESASTIAIWTAKANANNINFSFLYPLN